MKGASFAQMQNYLNEIHVRIFQVKQNDIFPPIFFFLENS